MTHSLKTWPMYYRAVEQGIKQFELRANDRNYLVGDTLSLEEWDPDRQQYTGRTLLAKVLYILHGPAFGLLAADHCIMSISVYGGSYVDPSQAPMQSASDQLIQTKTENERS